MVHQCSQNIYLDHTELWQRIWTWLLFPWFPWFPCLKRVSYEMACMFSLCKFSFKATPHGPKPAKPPGEPSPFHLAVTSSTDVAFLLCLVQGVVWFSAQSLLGFGLALKCQYAWVTEYSLADAQAAEVISKATKNLFKLAFMAPWACQKTVAWRITLWRRFLVLSVWRRFLACRYRNGTATWN